MIAHINLVETILYVRDQAESKKFYQGILRKSPDLDVPGMTEFILSESCKIGLMPNDGIAKLLTGKIQHPDGGFGIPRCELYFYVDNIETEFTNARECGAKLLSPISDRAWGDKVCYFSDPDGHIIAFAEKIINQPFASSRLWAK